MMETKIEHTPKKITDLELIGYISAGKNHSVAIKTFKVTEGELQMYSWGYGWHGQLGHGSTENQYKPKKVKIPSNRKQKFMMAAGGDKHTMFLDSTGQLWFSGQKQSIGVEDIVEEKQLTPTPLVNPNEPDLRFRFIAAGEDHTLAVATDGRVFGFGRNSNFKINSSENDLVYFEQIETGKYRF